MHRRALTLAVAFMLASPVAVFAQSGDKMVRIGILMADFRTPQEVQSLADGLREQGLVHPADPLRA